MLTAPSTDADAPPEQLNMIEKAILVLDNEADIVNVERDLREIQVLSDRGILEAGSLESHYSLQDSLEGLQEPLNRLMEEMSSFGRSDYTNLDYL